MENQSTRPPLVTISTQTEENNNYGKGRDPTQQELQPQIFPLSINPERMPDYRKHLSKVFGEEFLAEAIKQDRSLTPIIKMVRGENYWDSLKKTNKYFHWICKDLSATETSYNLSWFPCIHRCLTSKAQACEECTKQGKNLKPILPKQNLGKNSLNYQNLMKNSKWILQAQFHSKIILITSRSVDRYSRFSTAQVYKNCHASTAIEYLEVYCRFHGIPRSIRCDQAQAFKS